MSTEEDIDQLQRHVRYLMDRTEIVDCIAAHARGCDRHDEELLTSTYHRDSVDEHGHAINPGPEYAAWANQTHAASSQGHLHNITTHSCDIDGDVAHCESYVMVALLGRDGRHAQLINGRYIDRLEPRDGTWKIAVRRSTVELTIAADASVLQSDFFKQAGFSHGSRDKRDLLQAAVGSRVPRPGTLVITDPAPADRTGEST
jgi:SnoaL-like domain